MTKNFVCQPKDVKFCQKAKLQLDLVSRMEMLPLNSGTRHK